jgi:RHS repeat-associated protein
MSSWTVSFYGYDGHGSVRQLTNSAGSVTDSYDYDAFGNLINSTGSTPNNYLFAGEQYDPALGLYYNRARYLNTATGRFWSMDEWEGYSNDPRSLHKYLYASGNPIDRVDPSGHEDIVELTAAQGIMEELAAGLNSDLQAQQTVNRVKGTLDLVETVYQVINTIATGGISALLVGLPTFDVPRNAGTDGTFPDFQSLKEI